MNAALRTAAHEGCDVLVQVGDFWLQDRNWGCLAPGRAGLMLSAVRSEMPVVVDGNHEVCAVPGGVCEPRRTGRPASG